MSLRTIGCALLLVAVTCGVTACAKSDEHKPLATTTTVDRESPVTTVAPPSATTTITAPK